MSLRYVGAGVLSVLMVIALITVAPVLSAVAPTVRVVVGVYGPYSVSMNMLLGIGRVDLEVPEIGAMVLEVPSAAVIRIAALPFVRYVEEDKLVKAEEVGWNVEIVNATDVWNMSSEYGNAALGYYPDITIAVLDTGIDYAHSDLKGAVVFCIVSLRDGKTFYRGTNLKNCADPNGHGTHVAGIISARLNGAGIAGVAPKSGLYAVRVLDASGKGYVSDVAKGIVESVKGPDGLPGTDDDADVISMSLGGPDSQILRDAVSYAYGYGVVLVAAAGNEGALAPSCPACYSEVIAVGAADSSYAVPDWSNRSPDIVAPGVNILSTWPKNRYAYASGTSMACPHVSAAVAIVQAMRLASSMYKLAPGNIKDVLASSAIDLGKPGYDSSYGYGFLDVYELVRISLSK
ncbi:MAG: S8 family peptidase [Sulfolobales archaeon]